MLKPSSNSNGEVQMRGYTGHKQDLQTRLRRIEGQVRGLQRMVDEDTYCIDVLTQISAATQALQSVAVELLDDHLGHCVREAIATGGPDADAKVAEASAAIARLVRSYPAQDAAGAGRYAAGARC
jgi:DNA-binding FrmR family transcriptional regulator